MGWRHLIIAALLLSPLAATAQDWRDVRDQSRQNAQSQDDSENRIHIYRDKPRSYVGLNLGHAILEFDGIDEDVTLTTLNARLGAMTSDHFGMEARFGVGIDNHTLRNENDPRDKLDQSLGYVGGLYFTGRAGLMRLPYNLGRVYTQGYLGFGTGQVKNETRICNAGVCDTDSESDSESGFSWGLALGVQPIPEISLGLEYIQYFSGDDADLNTIEAGVMYHF